MPECVSEASHIVIGLSWVSLLLLSALLILGLRRQLERRSLTPLLLLSFAHPILWTRGSAECNTPLEQSTLLFTILGLLSFLWAQKRSQISLK